MTLQGKDCVKRTEKLSYELKGGEGEALAQTAPGIFPASLKTRSGKQHVEVMICPPPSVKGFKIPPRLHKEEEESSHEDSSRFSRVPSSNRREVEKCEKVNHDVMEGWNV